ncbi:hypothetical protein [Mycobacteroides immunogenum]|uniref:Uncharacterized protein n=1 Tax=Mycobacteroides immunogenum TaxID=83262 RepID=A0A7V8LRA6_9MYCO|nr:hypothetical protein [Mycobacteroides immunogenum]AMT70499.1 hypothetical protein ABG82_09335 [Mycobacteroides immunogenum]ANO03571.1 hypothetical protein BAB75_09395 [Mycobacteroides immunogenum]KIU41971.1 hypothetical protein TL11_02250 [Mycobacteroides immunogenum]KPG13586.1 hypothetical protein AN909_04665 [Mycobacteroides immunogenum]KPG14493.1 hypothetical protein AN908_08200 [Mycobacteroides immunogenum]
MSTVEILADLPPEEPIVDPHWLALAGTSLLALVAIGGLATAYARFSDDRENAEPWWPFAAGLLGLFEYWRALGSAFDDLPRIGLAVAIIAVVGAPTLVVASRARKRGEAVFIAAAAVFVFTLVGLPAHDAPHHHYPPPASTYR